MELNVNNPVVLLMGKTGAGKSTLGNLLVGAPYDNGPFPALAQMDSVTKKCTVATILIDGVPYNIVDTPGTFDTQQGSVPVLNEIAKIINKCAHGVKAILIVFEAGRFTEEQRNVLGEIRTFLGKDATNNIILVFSHATKTQTDDRNVMESNWNYSFRSFIQSMGNRWGISPDPEKFSPDGKTHRERLREIKDLISSIQGVYTTTQLENNLREQAEAKRRKEEDEKEAQRKYEEKLKNDAKREAEKANQSKIDQMRQDSDIRHRQILDSMEQERKARERREEDLRRELKLMHQKKKERRENERQERERQESRVISIELEILRPFPSSFPSLPSLFDIFSLVPLHEKVSICRNEKVKALENHVPNSISSVSFYKNDTIYMEKENKISTYFTDNEMSSQVKITARSST